MSDVARFSRIAAGGLLAAGLVALVGSVGHWRTDRLVQDGSDLVHDSQYVAAARKLLRAVAIAPNDARAHYYLGLAYAGLGQEAPALSHAEDAVRLAPRVPEFQAGLAVLMLDAGRAPEALARLRGTVAVKPDSADIRLLFADVLRRTGDLGGMEREYRAAMRLAGDSTLGVLAREQLNAALAVKGSVP